jgi:hypothetical protein
LNQRRTIICSAGTSFDYKDKFVEIAYSNLMAAPVGLESDVADPKAHASEGNWFLNRTDDNFSLGVEGAEITVLKGIGHQKFRFKFMYIETRSKDKVEAYLATSGKYLTELAVTLLVLFA